MLELTDKTFQTDNWAELLDSGQRAALSSELMSQINVDEESRSEWLKDSEQWIKLAMQVMEGKSFPWPNSSNVLYPLLTSASMQFHSRAQQSLLKGNKPVKAKILGGDTTGEKTQKAQRIQDFMGFLLKHHIYDWEDEVDRMLMVLPIVGMAFKKVYYSNSLQRARSELVLASDLILNYHATDFERARKTHIMSRYHNEVVEMQRAGFFLKEANLHRPNEYGDEDVSPQERELYECHCWYDLDDDGYDEPYVVIIDKTTHELLRISPRFGPDDVTRNESNEIVKITPMEFFIRFVFLPSVDSKLYGVGLGTLLGPTNMAVNTLINQLVDAGTLAVLPSGFLGRGSRVARGGTMRFGPGEWKNLQSTGDDLRKSIFPLPIKEPSNVLFSLLGTLIESGQQIGSVADIMMGENPGQNQPYSTTQAVLEQGMKVFVGIYKRIYRSMSFEYRQLLAIMSEQDARGEMYSRFFDVPGLSLATDYSPRELDIAPISDPDMVSEAQRLIKAESLLQKAMAGLPINVTEVTKRVLEAEDHENIEALMQVPPKEPDPDHVAKMTKIQMDAMVEMARLNKEIPESHMSILKDYAQAMVNFAKARDVAATTELAAERDAADAYLESKKIDAMKEAKDANARAGQATEAATNSSRGS